MSPPTRRRRPRTGRLHLVPDASKNQDQLTCKAERCADLALTTERPIVVWLDDVQVVFMPDIEMERIRSAGVATPPPSWRIERSDGRYCVLYRWPGEVS